MHAPNREGRGKWIEFPRPQHYIGKIPVANIVRMGLFFVHQQVGDIKVKNSTSGITLEPELLALLGHGLCAVAPDGTIIEWNHILSQAGVSESDAIGKPLGVVLSPCLVEAQVVLDALESSRADGKSKTLQGLQWCPGTNRSRWFNVFIYHSANDLMLLAFQDITEHRTLRQQLEKILDSTPDGIFVTDRSRRVILFNKAFTRITGKKPVEIFSGNCTCGDMVHCHNASGESYASDLCPAKAIFAGDMTHRTEEMLINDSTGHPRWVETTYSSIHSERGEVDFVIGVLRDVHERKHLEERLNQTEKLASLGQLVAGIAHEIKNPLAIILSSLDIIENPQRSDDQRSEATTFIREEIKRLDERLREFLSFARPRELTAAPMPINELLREQVERIGPLFPELKLELDLLEESPVAGADREQIQQVITNLLLNAGDAVEGSGTIALRSRYDEGHAVLEIEDSGPGIAKEYAARVFDPFFTTKTKGTGLGLSICYQIVLAHHGTLSISNGNQLGGACFTIRLPRASGNA